MPGVRITDVSTTGEPECTANQRTGGAIVVQGFGSSDCTSDCGSHLKLNDDRVRYLVVNIVREAAADAGLEPAALPESPKLSEPVGN